jgi:hypothetical protein
MYQSYEDFLAETSAPLFTSDEFNLEDSYHGTDNEEAESFIMFQIER